ncbi:hypothetical protein [Streptosporangium sp. NPDC049046]|uniref:hypothetical protein n=1 Tax=Streptosporangium sp. NPDC049046 TaxID=3155031 RepID=UPI003411F8B4
MPALDPRTIERVARIICDLDGPFERYGRDLETLLLHSGWTDPPLYDGTPRIPWLVDAMKSATAAEVERLVCRVCHPVEYDEGGISSAGAVRDAINHALANEGLTISYISDQPIMGRLSNTGSTVYTAPEDLESRLPALIDDAETVAWLVARANETRICEANGAYVFALVGIGSFVEHLLLSVLTRWDNDIREHGFTDQTGRAIRGGRVSLDQLIRIAYTRGFIKLDRKEFIDKVREYRNFVHLQRQSAMDLHPDPHTVMMCWGPVRAILVDLEDTVASRR